MNSLSKYLYIYKEKNHKPSLSERRLLHLCVKWSISVHDPISELNRVIAASPGSTLNIFYEAIHIDAWFSQLKAKGEDGRIWQYRPDSRLDFSHKLLVWWKNTKRDEGMELASKNPHFSASLQWFREQEKTEKVENEPDLWEELKDYPDSRAYQTVKAFRDEYEGEDIDKRFQSLLTRIGFREAEYQEILRRLIDFYDHQRIPPDLCAYIKTRSAGLGSTISIMQKGGKLANLMRDSINGRYRDQQAAPALKEEGVIVTSGHCSDIMIDPIIPEPEYDLSKLTMVRFRLPGVRMPLVGWIIADVDDHCTVKLAGPVDIPGQGVSHSVTIERDKLTAIGMEKHTAPPSPELQEQLARVINAYSERTRPNT